MTEPASASSPGGDAPRWRLRPTFELFPADDGDVYLLQAGGQPVVVRQPSAADRRLLEAADRLGLEIAPHSEAAERLQPLVDAGIVVPDVEVRLPGDDAARFDRQLGYLAEFGDPGLVQRRIRAATVAVLGCGGVGTWALGALAGLGVGRFVLIDDDRVELSNLNRQVLYRYEDVGSLKVERAAAWLRGFDPAVEVETVPARVEGADALDEILPRCDLLMMAADSPPHELTRWVNRVAVERRLPFATAGLQTPLARVGPLYCPGCGPCHACHETQIRRAFPRYEELARHQDRHPPRAITIGPGAGVVGTMIATDALNLLAGGVPAASDRALTMDLRKLEFRTELVRRDPGCVVCSHLFTEAQSGQHL